MKKGPLWGVECKIKFLLRRFKLFLLLPKRNVRSIKKGFKSKGRRMKEDHGNSEAHTSDLIARRSQVPDSEDICDIASL
jgi:hypothetical protein